MKIYEQFSTTEIITYSGQSPKLLMMPKRFHQQIKTREYASHLVKQNIETSHTDVNTANFKTIDMNFSNNKTKEEIVESLWIKDLRPTLSVQEKSIPLKLFN